MDIYEYQFPSSKRKIIKVENKSDIEDVKSDTEDIKKLSPGKGKNTIIIKVVVIFLFIGFIVLSVLTYVQYGKDNNNIKYLKHTIINSVMNKNYISSHQEWNEYTNFRNINLESKFYDEPMEKHRLNIVFNDVNFDTSLTYLIKNVLFKFNGSCMITVVANKDDYEEVKNLCDKISENITVIENNNPVVYNKELINKLYGANLLFHDMNSILLTSDLSDYIKYDYVGIDGFCLINKNALLNILRKDKITTHSELVSKFTNIPNKEKTENFVVDNEWNKETVGCHNFWVNGVYIEDLN